MRTLASSIQRLVGEDYLSKKYLIAVSGGKDSMVLLDMMYCLGIEVCIAHCNFSLRGEESDLDEAHVLAFADTNSISYISKKFETKKYAESKNISIQMAARELRYEWFENVRKSKDLDYIVTAHHRSDQIETVLINLFRGSGPMGLKGIPEVNGKIIRPLLIFDSTMIQSWCDLNKLPYRTDSSNADVKYMRNKLRNNVMPILKSNFAQIEHGILTSSHIQREIATSLAFIATEWIGQKDHLRLYPMGETLYLPDTPLMPIILRYYCESKDFSPIQISQLKDSIEKGRKGKKIVNMLGAEIISGRSSISYLPGDHWNPEIVLNLIPQTVKWWGGKVTITEANPGVDYINDLNTLVIGVDNVRQIILRIWWPGDHIKLKGMKGASQKLQDLYTNQKFEITDKLNQPVVVLNGEIIWLPGLKHSEYQPLEGQKRLIIKVNKQKTLPSDRENL